ncbi:MAG: TetR/AcrR family transcriptional regulator [Myxococcota bacterium]
MSSAAATDWLGGDRQELAGDRILDATRVVLARDGIRGARMGRIAEVAGCSRATLYRYFPNKEALLQAYMVHIADGFRAVLAERLRGMRSFEERFIEASAVSVELMQSREDVAPFFTEEGVGLTAQLTGNAAAMRDQMAKLLAYESESSKIDGSLRAGVTPAEAAEWATRAIFSLATVPIQQRSGQALRDYLRKMLVPALVAGETKT